MIKFENTDVWGFKHAIFGMRNPMNSHGKSDTVIMPDGSIEIGDSDLRLAQNLIKAGGEHSKFMRMIHVGVNITAPLFFWSEFDTYHFNTKNSQSTMHKLLQDSSYVTREDFVDVGPLNNWKYDEAIKCINEFKDMYKTNIESRNSLIREAKAILPSGYLQMRTVDTNYAELRSMYLQRRDHRLIEWNTDFVNWIKTLPYEKELITYEG